MWDTIFCGEVSERECGVGCEVEGGVVLELDFSATVRAGGEGEAGLEWDVRGGLLPGVAGELLVLFAAGDADVAFDEAEANDLRIGDV